jgi:beta-lysine 5,6-aminomutase beta subunit
MFVVPYGDTLNDGAVQLSFTLPLSDNARGREAARQLVLKHAFTECEIVHSTPLTDGFTLFVVYAKTALGVDTDKIEVEDTGGEEVMDFYQINDFIRAEVGREIVIVGACTGFDAHTVGIDAIMNMKGYDGHYGLERYPMIEAYNLGAQVPNERLLEFSLSVNADAILISRIVTQKNTHIEGLTDFVELVEAENVRDRFIIIAGGPRISHRLALELGFDAGFGRNTFAEHVALFVAKRMVERGVRKS